MMNYYINQRLQANLQQISKRLKQKDQDFVMVIDGAEGVGKSVFGMQIGMHVDPTLSLDRICMSHGEFKDVIKKANQYQCIIYDEAFTGLSSRSSLSQINRMLVTLMMQMRQKNLFVIVILPSFFMLDKYVALWRARCLIHVYESKGRRLFFVFNRKNKKILWLNGSKTYTYAETIRRQGIDFKGEFHGKYVVSEKDYRDKKRKALEHFDELIDEHKKYMIQRNVLINILHDEFKLSAVKQQQLFEKYNLEGLQRSGIGLIIRDAKDKKKKLQVL